MSEFSASELPPKTDTWAYLPLNYRHVPFTSYLRSSVTRLISSYLKDKAKANEISLEYNIICYWKRGAKTKRTCFLSLKDSYMAVEDAGETAELSSPAPQWLSVTRQKCLKLSFSLLISAEEHLAHHAF